MKKWMLILLVATLSLTALSAGGSVEAENPDEPVTIRFMWWGSQTRHDTTIKVIELFMEENPDIIVEYEYGSFENHFDKILTMMTAGDAPDVFQNSTAYILMHAQNGQLLDLQPYIDSGAIDLSDWDDVFKTLGVVEGGTYGLTMGNSAFGMLYDPILFEEAGIPAPTNDWTWDDYHEALRLVKEKTGLYGDSCYPASMIEGYVMYLRQHGYIGLFNETRDGLAYDGTDLWVEYFTKQQEMMDKGYVMPYDQAIDSIISFEQCGLALGTAGMLGCINSNQAVAIANAKGSPVALMPFPHMEGEPQPGTFIGPTMFLSVAKTTKHPEAVARFIDFFLNDPEANEIMMMERGVPASAGVRAVLEPQLDEVAADSSRYVGETAAVSVPFDNIYPAAYNEILDLYRRTVEDMMFGRVSIEEGGIAFNQQAAALLAGR